METELRAELSHLRHELAIQNTRLNKLELLYYNRIGKVPPTQPTSIPPEQKQSEIGSDAPAGLFSLTSAEDAVERVKVAFAPLQLKKKRAPKAGLIPSNSN